MTKYDMVSELVPRTVPYSGNVIDDIIKHNKKERIEKVYKYFLRSAQTDRDKYYCRTILLNY